MTETYYLFLGILLTFMLIVSTVQAEDNDPDSLLPIEISADTFVTNVNTSISTYTGNVQLKQGSLVLKADTVTIVHPNNVMKNFVATGANTSFEKTVHKSKKSIKGNANEISFTNPEVVLTKNANITFDGNTIMGDFIRFNIDTESIQATSVNDNNDSTLPTNNVRIILQPDVSTDESVSHENTVPTVIQ